MDYDETNEKDIEIIRKDFPVTKKKIYMNCGSFAPMPLSTIKSITDFLVKCSEEGPDSTSVQEYITSLMKDLRILLSQFINCEPEEIVFTQSTTEGLNIVASGIEWKKKDWIIARGGLHEHYANYFPWLNISKKFGVKLKEITIDNKGFFDLDMFDKIAKSNNGKLITLSHVLYNNGAIMPVEQVGKIAKRHNILYCIDAAQSLGTINVDVKKIGCDFLAFPGFKWICGPPGIGVFYCKRESSELLIPQYIGGESAIITEENNLVFAESPQKFQTGFRNYVGVAGLASSLKYIQRLGISTIRKMNMKVANEIIEQLKTISGVSIFGPEDEKLRTSIVSFTLDSINPKNIVATLEERGIIVAERDVVGGGRKKAVRASPHFFNVSDEGSEFVENIKAIQNMSG
ncbi:MAG TPA: aminotransferase class V-fold PLP-dependent enzyme [Nitrososphaeraceae archaeon]|jgi:cysteine desulfurase / selenocysteine lyase|nr:aminotransferase class V-fold PLP-dependent enzyme [Nitrososphaeraceae archaeon]